MILLVSGASATVRAHDDVGVLLVPGARNRPIAGRAWAIDNGAFAGFDEAAFLALLDRTHAEGHGRPLFVTAPDVVADHAATLERFRTWEPRLRAYGWPVAFVLQDGCQVSAVPWARCDAVFVGGSTEFKVSDTARDLVACAKARGKWTHMGRVNTKRRIRLADSWGIDSFDGSGFSKWAAARIPLGLAWAQQRALRW